jgi:hypothetical protein
VDVGDEPRDEKPADLAVGRDVVLVLVENRA